jgi:SAM-dependent methyltransferase
MSHYNKQYFDWQKNIGQIGGYLNMFKFEKYINSNDKLLDFGCGGGYLLKNFNVKEKFGFEINVATHQQCKEFNINVTDKWDDLQDNYFDTIISNHAMEHVHEPLNILKNLYKKLKPNGKLVIVIPCEQPSETGFHYKENDINQHLYTWCPMTFGNLAKLAGFNIITCNTIQHQWCPDYQTTWGKTDFYERCVQHAKKNGNYQVRLIATKLN